MNITHPFVSAIADGTDATVVRPSDWNAGHVLNMAASSRVVGRDTAGAGVAEEVTASQILDWVSNTNGVLLTRVGGSWTTVSNVSVDTADLKFVGSGAPSQPSTGAKLYNKFIGGRQMLGAFPSAGAMYEFQPHIGRRTFVARYWNPGQTTQTLIGGAGVGIAMGTATLRVFGQTNLYTTMGKVGFVSPAGAGSIAGLTGLTSGDSAVYWRGNASGLGGFHYFERFAVSDAVIVGNGRMNVGMGNRIFSLPVDVDPSTIVNQITIGCNSGDTTLKLYSSGAVAQTPVDLGANFPINVTTKVDVYEFILFCAPNSSQVTYRVERLNTGDVASGTISNAANLPSTTTNLQPQFWRSNGATASAVGIDEMLMYVESGS